MPQFIFAYHGGKKPESEAEGAKEMEAWKNWMGSMGEALKIPGAPVGMSKTVSAGGVVDNGGANPLSGYTVVEAADQDAACEMAKGCPMVVSGNGSVEVAEIIDMEM
ncbi:MULTISPECIES: YciI family protein [unclassified Leisingera]|uniref:YciI family protein n=1 Tax=unclassified Leisingera TaxID=2614906 RepID=UPI0010119F55|nr:MULTISPECIES: YciI family protein [unclassified Leisingera]MBQ4825557.1 hypothetical protein [Leisingera sp. HS039]MCF6430719.1 YciI family protein [Leisingera sp. MMG026]QAX31585.1 hypothetical protein ETW24_20590 [Leisingera sp. NJS204]QBR37945.1 hypothetical protein ETW23_19380 [Leisingera sp. NJS201]